MILKRQQNIGRNMKNNYKNFNELVIKKLKDKEFAQAYIMNLINKERMSLESALRETIISMGVQAFADKVDVSVQYLSDFVNKKHPLSTSEINQYLQKAFNLKVTITIETTDKEVA